MLKNLFTVIAAILGGMPLARAQNSAEPYPAAPEFTTSLTPAYVSQYMFRGQRLSGQSFEPSIELDYGQLGVGVWANFPLSKKVDGVSDPEVDPYAYFTVPISSDLSFVPGITAYAFPRANTARGFYRSTLEPNLALSWNLPGLRLTPKIYYDVVLQGSTYEVSAAHALPLKTLGTELDFTAQVGSYQQRDAINRARPKVKTWGQYWLLGVTAPFQISATSRVSLGFAYTAGEGAFVKQGVQPRQKNPLAVGRGVVTLSFTCTF